MDDNIFYTFLMGGFGQASGDLMQSPCTYVTDWVSLTINLNVAPTPAGAAG